VDISLALASICLDCLVSEMNHDDPNNDGAVILVMTLLAVIIPIVFYILSG
jgi:hypothetical protein